MKRVSSSKPKPAYPLWSEVCEHEHGIPLSEADIQPYLDTRRPGQSRFTTQRQEPDTVKILSGVFADEASGRQVTTGTPIALLIDNGDTPANSFGKTTHYKVGFTLIQGFATSTLALQEAVRRLRTETGATTWVVAVDQDPVSQLYSAFGAGIGQ